MTTHLGLQRILLPSAQVSSLTTGSITLPSARGMFSLPYSGYSVGKNDTSAHKFNFYSETSSILSATLSASYNSTGAGLTRGSTAGYFAGGSSNTSTQANNKLTFSTETFSNPGNMGGGRLYGCSISNESTAGYVTGGEISSPLTYFTDVTKFTYSGETWSQFGSGNFNVTNNVTGGENGSTAGYHWGGFGGGIDVSKKITFSNDTSSLSFTAARIEYAGKSPSNGTTAGYQMGGMNGGTGAPTNVVRKLTYSGESYSVLATTLSVSRYRNINFSDYTTSAFSMGGEAGSGSFTTIQKMPYSTDTLSTLSATLSSGRAEVAAVNYHV